MVTFSQHLSWNHRENLSKAWCWQPTQLDQPWKHGMKLILFSAKLLKLNHRFDDPSNS